MDRVQAGRFDPQRVAQVALEQRGLAVAGVVEGDQRPADVRLRRVGQLGPGPPGAAVSSCRGLT